MICEHEGPCGCSRKVRQLTPRPRRRSHPKRKPVDAGAVPGRSWKTLSAMVLARAGGVGHWDGPEFILLRAGRCERCGKRPAVDPHHRKLKSEGGADAASNLAALCRICHDWCHENVAEARKAGWIVPSGADPACRALLLFDGSMVLLDDEAGYAFVGFP